MHHCQNNLEACALRATELGVDSLDMSTEYVEFLKRGRREYKALEAIVKGWKAKAVEDVPEAPPKKCTMHASKAKATDASGTDASIKVSCMIPSSALTEKWCAFSARLSACLLPLPLCLLCAARPAYLGT
jgi:hypothetical protein